MLLLPNKMVNMTLFLARSGWQGESGSWLALQLHDELIYEVREAAKKVVFFSGHATKALPLPPELSGHLHFLGGFF